MQLRESWVVFFQADLEPWNFSFCLYTGLLIGLSQQLSLRHETKCIKANCNTEMMVRFGLKDSLLS